MTMGKAPALNTTFYMPRDQLEAWFARAAERAKTAYARGPGLDGRNEIAVLTREWSTSGEAELFKTRDPATGELLHCLRRLRPMTKADARELRRVAVDDEFRESAEGKIFLTLVRSANLGRACPSNAELAKVAGLRNADAARYVLHEKLVKLGRIEVRHEGAGNAQRRVRIIETGKWTAAPSAAGATLMQENGR